MVSAMINSDQQWPMLWRSVYISVVDKELLISQQSWYLPCGPHLKTFQSGPNFHIRGIQCAHSGRKGCMSNLKWSAHVSHDAPSFVSLQDLRTVRRSDLIWFNQRNAWVSAYRGSPLILWLLSNSYMRAQRSVCCCSDIGKKYMNS